MFNSHRVLLAASLLSVLGCSGATADSRYAVRGRVTVGDRPAAHVLVTFQSEDLRHEATAETNSAGVFAVSTLAGEGLPAGKYRVAVKPGRILGKGEERNPTIVSPHPEPQISFPAKYYGVSSSEIILEVHAAHDGEYLVRLSPQEP